MKNPNAQALGRGKTSPEKGQPVKRKRGRPPAGRACSLPRVSEQAKSLFAEIAEFQGCSLARAVEIAADVAMDAMEGRPVQQQYLRYP
jgi:hypothetical protein